MDDAKIKVEGLAELNRALRRIDKDAPKGLRLAQNEAADTLIDHTRPIIPKRSGRAGASLKAKSTRTSARVSVGGTRARWYPWLDFGGEGPAGRPARRQFIREGRYLYPTLRRVRPEIEEKLGRALVAAARGAGLEVDS